MNADIEKEDFNALQIREFLNRAPVLKTSIGICTGFNLLTGEKLTDGKPNEVVSTEVVAEYHPDDPVLEVPIKHGIHISDSDQSRLPSELQNAIREYLTDTLGPMVDQPMNKATLMRPIEVLSAFFEAFVRLGHLKDFSVYFDLERSSHRSSSIAYHIDIDPVEITFFEQHGANLWLQFTKLLRPEVVDFASIWLKWLMEHFHSLVSQ